MIFALKTWRHYLYGVDVDVFTNHKTELARDVHRLTRLGVRLFNSTDMSILIQELSRIWCGLVPRLGVCNGSVEEAQNLHLMGSP